MKAMTDSDGLEFLDIEAIAADGRIVQFSGFVRPTRNGAYLVRGGAIKISESVAKEESE